jgi:hypothetical protein
MQARHHFTKVAIILTLGCISTVLNVRGDEVKVENGSLVINGSADHLDQLTPELQAEIVPQVRVLLTSSNYQDQDTATRALLSINDPVTIQALVKRYQENDDVYAYRYLDSSGNEAIISYLISDAAVPTTKMATSLTGMKIPARAASSFLILHAVERSGQFGSGTRAWAKQTLQKYLGNRWNLVDLSAEEEEWWTHNKDAILAGQYGRASWLPDQESSSIPGMPTPFPRISRVNTTTSTGATPKELELSTGVARFSDGSLWIYGVAGVALAGLTGLGIWHLRNR